MATLDEEALSKLKEKYRKSGSDKDRKALQRAKEEMRYRRWVERRGFDTATAEIDFPDYFKRWEEEK